MRKIIVASHGKLSQGIVNTLGIIMGEESVNSILTYSLFPGEDVKEIADSIESELKCNSEKQLDYIILTDLLGGSVDNAILKFIAYPNVWVISGVNLMLLLGIILSDPSKATQNILEEAIENGKAGIVLRDSWPSVENDELEDL